MRKSVILSIMILLLASAVFVLLDSRASRDISNRSIVAASPAEIEAELLRRYEKAVPNSPEAFTLQQSILKVRKKAFGKIKQAENPGAFYEALADLKTAPDGRGYSANYKSVELSKARKNMALRASSPGRLDANDVLPWRERGPGNVSGRARGLVVDAADPSGNTWFAATVGGGVWKTSDAGATWQHKTPELTVYSTAAIAQSQSNPDVLYVGTGMGYGRVVELVGNGIWKSTDHGETWFQLSSTANGELLEAVNRIVVDPNDENTVLVCSNDSFAHLYVKGGARKSGIFKTTDGGESWRQVFDADAAFGSNTDNRVQQIIANPQNFKTLYAAVNEIGVIKSTDAGETWMVSANNFALAADVGTPSGNGFGLAGISVRTELAISPTDTARLYAAVERPRGVGDLYMSANAGASWVLVNDTGSDPNWFNAFSQSGAVPNAYTAGWFDNTIAVHPFDPDVVFVGGVNIYRFDVDPANSTRVSTRISYWLNNLGWPWVHADQHDLKMVPINASAGTFRIVNANDGGVAFSDDAGASWRQTSGMITTQFYGVDKKPGEDVYIGGMQDNGTWSSGPNPSANSPWQPELGGDGFEAVWHYTDPNLVLGGSQGGNYLRSTDGAISWTAIPEAQAGPSPFISKLANSKADPDLVFTVGFNGINRSDDFGASWVLTPIQGNWLGYRPFDNCEVSIVDPKVVWISSRLDVDPPIGRAGGIHVSRDGGVSFVEISQNFPSGVTESSGIGTHPNDPATAYFLFSAPGQPKILKTSDYGQTFTDLSGFANSAVSSNGFPDVAVFSLLVMPFNPDILWVGTEIGLFVSENGGQSWQIADNGVPTVSIFEMKIVDDQVVVATYGRGIWSVTLPELAEYTPPKVTLTPRLRPLVQDFSQGGLVTIPIDLRDAYDSTHVFLDGALLARFGANTTGLDTTLAVLANNADSVTVSVTAFDDGTSLKSAVRTLATVALGEAVASINLDFDSGSFQDFASNAFTVSQPNGFANRAIHSPHPYPNGSNLIFTLLRPFVLSTGTIAFEEIVLVEPGTSNDWTNVNFFDFCVVEGSIDGLTWQALAPGYDARDDANWLSAYNNGTMPSPSLFRPRTIEVPDGLFNKGDKVFLRFRLSSDPAVVGWGWAIDNLKVQPDAAVPEQFDLAQNYPNPFNPTTTIEYALPQAATVSLVIYNVMGQRVRHLIRGVRTEAGSFSMQWDGRDDSGVAVASGTYLYRLQAGDFVQNRKMLLLR